MVKSNHNINSNKKQMTLSLMMSILYFGISDISRALAHVGISRVISYIVYILIFILFALKYLPRLRICDIVYHIIIIPIAVSGLGKYAAYINSDSNVYAMVIMVIPSYYFYRVCDDDNLVEGNKRAATFSTIYLLIYYFVYIRRTSGYDMNYAYWIAPPMCVNFYYYLEKKIKLNLISSVIMFITLVLSGSRGALGLSILCLLYFIVFRKHNLKIAIVTVLFIITASLFVFFYPDIVFNFLNRFSGKSRNIMKLLNGDFLQSSSRDKLYEICKKLIDANPNGYGPLASRELIDEYPYPHSIFYELQLDFGRDIGICVFVMIFAMAAFNIIYYCNKRMQVVVGIIEILGLCSLMVSSSYYQETYVPATIALFVNAMIKRKKRNRIKHHTV